MSLRNVAGLYLVRLRGRIGQELLAFAGIAVGVSLLFAALVANSSLTGSFQRLTDGIVGRADHQLAARGSSTLDERLLARVQGLPGVSAAVGFLEVPAEAIGPGGRRAIHLTGVTSDFGALHGSYTGGFSYRFLADVRAMALPAPLAEALDLSLGQPVALNVGGTVRPARLGAKLQRSDIGGMIGTGLAVAPLGYAQELAGAPGRVSRILVVAAPGRSDDVERALTRVAAGRANVLPADFDAEIFRQASQPSNQSTTMFSVFGSLVGFLFAFSAMLLTVPQRRHLIADLDAEGYRPGTVVKVLLFDAVVLGAIASAAGIALGDQVARRLFDATPSFLEYAFAVGSERIVTPANVVLAAVGGVLASCIAVLGPTLSSLRSLDLDERSRHPGGGASRRAAPIAAGLAALGGGIAIVVAAPASAPLGIAGLGLLTASMLLLLPAFLSLLVSGFDLLTAGVRGVVPFLVSFDLRDATTHARSVAVAATGAIAVFASVALQGAHADLLRGLDRTSEDIAALADVWVRPPAESNMLMTNRFDPPAIPPVAEVRSRAAFHGSFLDVGTRRTRVMGIAPGGRFPLSSFQIVDGDRDEAVARLRDGGWVVVSAVVARELGRGVGDAVELPTPVPVTLRIAALSTNLGWPPGTLILNGRDFERAWGDDAIGALLATPAAGVSPEAGAAALRAAIEPPTRLLVQSAQAHAREQRDASRAGVERLSQIAALVLVSAVLAMASAMAGLIWQRRAFIAGVKVEGYGTADMWKALLIEAGILIGAGCAIGAAFGLLGQGLLSRALTSVTGFPVVYSPALVGAVTTCAAVTAAALAIVAVFGQRAASVAPETSMSR